MRISRKAEYALRALVAMARQARSWSIAELARSEAIPPKNLEQVLLALRHTGLLRSTRGVRGGYTLTRDPSSISVAEVITMLDGPLAPVPCAAENPKERCTCPDPRTCAVRAVMTEARKQLDQVLGSRTIEDLRKLNPGNTPLAFEI